MYVCIYIYIYIYIYTHIYTHIHTHTCIEDLIERLRRGDFGDAVEATVFSMCLVLRILYVLTCDESGQFSVIRLLLWCKMP